VRREASASSIWVRFKALYEENLVCFRSAHPRPTLPTAQILNVVLTGLLISQVIEAEMVGMTNLQSFSDPIRIVEVARNEILVKIETAKVPHCQRSIRHGSAEGTPNVDDLHGISMKIPKTTGDLHDGFFTCERTRGGR
jgi:hypothetical protein